MRILPALALIVVVAGFGVVAVRGIASPWSWGHNGWNSASFTQAARNSLRFGVVGQAREHGGLEPPPSSRLYTGHPLMLHAHLVGAFALFGDEEWVARSIPAAYGVLTLLLLYIVVRRGFGWQTALAATVTYALIPLNLIYANMVNHEQGSIFWCLLLVLFYVRWHEERRWWDMAGALAAVTVAAQFDWPAYFIAFFLALHAFGSASRRRTPWWRWRHDYTWLVAFCVVVLANFFGFFAWVRHMQAGLGQMGNAFTGRFGMPWEYPALALERSWYLHGPLLQVTGLGWVAWTLLRLRRRQLHRGHLIPAVFLGAQVLHSTVFGKAGMFHEYWAYHASPAIAVATGETVVASLRALHGRLAERPRARVLAPTILGGLLILGQVAVTGTSYARFYDTGGSLFHPSYRDLRPQSRWARELRRLYPRGTARFIVHPSIPPPHVQLLYYLDSPMRVGTGLDGGGPRRILIADLDDRSAPRITRHELSKLATRYGLRLFDRRFVAVDTELARGSVRQLVSRPIEMSFGEAWLLGGASAGRVEWVQDPSPAPLEDLLRSDLVQVRATGGGGGEPYRAECAQGSPFLSFAVSSTRWDPTGTQVVGALKPRCPDGELDWLREVPRKADGIVGVRCKPGDSIVGIVGRSGQVVDELGLLCESKEAAARPKAVRYLPRYETERVGSEGGTPFALSCPQGSRVSGVLGRAGLVLDAVGVACTPTATEGRAVTAVGGR